MQDHWDGRSNARAPGRWERLFADLEAGIDEAERADLAAEVADRTRGEVGRLRLVDRLRTAVGHRIGLSVLAGPGLAGVLRDVGADWLLIAEAGSPEVLVALPAVCAVSGLGALSAQPGSEGRVAARLDLRYALRRLARDRARATVTLTNGTALTGTCDRVGADFFELAEHAPDEHRRAGAVRQVRTVPISALAVMRPV